MLFDALEFDETLGTIDVAYDLAFLLMDLEHRLDRAAANRVLNRYVARTGDADLVGGLPVFLSMRAMVRAHVEARSGHAGRGRHLSGGRHALSEPAHGRWLIAIGGLPGSGKSTLARALAPALGPAPGALVAAQRRDPQAPARRDRRNRRCRSPPTPSQKSVGGIRGTGARWSETAARGGHAVIADATFMDPVASRPMIEAAAAQPASRSSASG